MISAGGLQALHILNSSVVNADIAKNTIAYKLK